VFIVSSNVDVYTSVVRCEFLSTRVNSAIFLIF
jgi:hypothetical protein